MLELHPELQRVWQQLGFNQPTPIQQESFKTLESGDDAVLSAPTGSGKTLAYVLPSLNRVAKSQGTQIMVVLPSQELAAQVGEAIKPWAEALHLKVVKLIGGANIKRQMEKLKKGPEIVVGTPGRLIELINNKKLKTHHLKILILDEADVLLDNEHLRTTQDIIHALPKYRQTILASATMTKTGRQIPEIVTESPQWFEVEASSQNNIRYTYLLTPVRKRDDVLRRLAQVEGMQAIVFVRTVADVEKLYQKLTHAHVPTSYLHRNMAGHSKQEQLQTFKNGLTTFLLTTDVAARGMDISDLPAVVEYDPAENREQYIHRSGRTGRMGQEGLVMSLVNERSLRDLQQLVPSRLDQVVLYQGQLLTPDEREKQKSESSESTPNKSKKGSSQRKKSGSSNINPEKKRNKKKNRRRKQKNKGARRK